MTVARNPVAEVCEMGGAAAMHPTPYTLGRAGEVGRVGQVDEGGQIGRAN